MPGSPLPHERKPACICPRGWGASAQKDPRCPVCFPVRRTVQQITTRQVPAPSPGVRAESAGETDQRPRNTGFVPRSELDRALRERDEWKERAILDAAEADAHTSATFGAYDERLAKAERERDEAREALRAARADIVNVNAAGFDSTRGVIALEALERIDRALRAAGSEEAEQR